MVNLQTAWGLHKAELDLISDGFDKMFWLVIIVDKEFLE